MNKKEYAQFLIDNADIIEITAGYRDLEKYVLNIKLEPLNNKTKAISKDILEVEIEEEITEDTVIPKMLVIYYKNAAHIQINKNLNFLIKDNLKSVYIMNDDLTMTLIWTIEKGLVD
ncbi:hypothetical protein MUA77_04125 [Mammaliicoccus sciuri]|nr:hypothetical protein [Mammaliicoccus sciuri]UXU84621.1 hypothetical protein MUA77_04125 [Mammaliicoccus sciuri]UXU94469.1 hypothetical protein MUA42_04135 [Mammaliicoccus sciuri]UXV16417.1 hypothetical protein MUA89_04130 [Mammaliicoccus sciuri]UXV24679.1 hypothetical protein MUA49_04130 [Mammaliicoccus sciuri]